MYVGSKVTKVSELIEMKVLKNNSLKAIKGGQIKEMYYYSGRRLDGIKLYSIISIDYDKEQKDPWIFIITTYYSQLYSPRINVKKASSRESFTDEMYFRKIGFTRIL
jgi:hypothetical protein